MAEEHKPEIIRSKEVLHSGDVDRVETRGEIIKIKASIAIAAASLAIACAILGLALYRGNSELQTWATGSISAIAGAAITYGFNSRRG
jgi:hypothetical protein